MLLRAGSRNFHLSCRPFPKLWTVHCFAYSSAGSSTLLGHNIPIYTIFFFDYFDDHYYDICGRIGKKGRISKTSPHSCECSAGNTLAMAMGARDGIVQVREHSKCNSTNEFYQSRTCSFLSDFALLIPNVCLRRCTRWECECGARCTCADLPCRLRYDLGMANQQSWNLTPQLILSSP